MVVMDVVDTVVVVVPVTVDVFVVVVTVVVEVFVAVVVVKLTVVVVVSVVAVVLVIVDVVVMVVVVVVVVVVEVTVVLVVESMQVEHITGHFGPTNEGKTVHIPTKTLQSSGSYSLLHLPSVVVVVVVAVVVEEVVHDPQSTGHVLRSSPDSTWPVHRSLETSPQPSTSGWLLHKPVVDVVEVAVVGTHESHIKGQFN